MDRPCGVGCHGSLVEGPTGDATDAASGTVLPLPETWHRSQDREINAWLVNSLCRGGLWAPLSLSRAGRGVSTGRWKWGPWLGSAPPPPDAAAYAQGSLDGTGTGDPQLPTDDVFCQDLEDGLGAVGATVVLQRSSAEQKPHPCPTPCSPLLPPRPVPWPGYTRSCHQT